MPPYRQPTPSPPPPPPPRTTTSSSVVVESLSSTATMIMASSSSEHGTKAPKPSGSSNGNGMTDNGGGFEIPANFVPPPPPREVATGVANLGNTCYMNAALQALAHAPELCHALDAECHLRKCPVALRNERRRRRNIRSRNTDVDDGDVSKHPAHRTNSKDSKTSSTHHRRSNSSSSNGSAGSGGSSSNKKRSKKQSGDANSNGGGGGGVSLETMPDYEYCTLCEVERLLGRVHSRPEEEILGDNDEDDEQEENVDNASATPPPMSSSGSPSPDAPFVPEAFVSGFMSKVAPWFRRGVQEDSHEFLRLLIDAMQTSCKAARAETSLGNNNNNKNNNNSVNINNNADDSRARGTVSSNDDNEYPFRLFRGTVESRVKCSACQTTSCKIDPIEDIGLDILPMKHDDVITSSSTSNLYSSSSRGGGGSGGIGGGGGSSSMSLSRSTSPTSNLPLADVTQALERFISSEHLDSGYKCEKCGKLGKATKTSKLASIPPILTLHLKRFRYGSGGGVGGGGGGSKRGGGGGGPGFYNENNSSGSTRSSSRSSARGGGGSNISQVDFDNVGPSGSAKIEGHVGFGPVLDMKPYLTPQLQQTVFQKAICRLFAVVVHSGKNSHSGHYVSYVHNVTKKEWWMMDDAKVVRSSWEEVRNAEAYMLFYRVTSHPVAMQLKSIADKKEEQARRIMEEIRRRERMARAAADEAEKAKVAAANAVLQHDLLADKNSNDNKVPDAMPSSDNEDNNGNVDADSSSTSLPLLGKRQNPELTSGEEWARVVTTLSPEYLPLFARIQEFIAENVTFSPEFFRFITEEYHRMSSKLSIGRRVKNNKRIRTLLGKGPRGVYPPEDVVGGAIDIQGGILDLFHQISIMYKANNKGAGGNESIFLPKIENRAESTPMFADTLEEEVEEQQPQSVLPATVPASPELIIPSDNIESYDGAL